MLVKLINTNTHTHTHTVGRCVVFQTGVWYRVRLRAAPGFSKPNTPESGLEGVYTCQSALVLVVVVACDHKKACVGKRVAGSALLGLGAVCV